MPFLSVPGRAGEGSFDAFVSYKSEDVELARRIAERLMASGLRIWFDEYQVLLTDRHLFQDAIDRGIALSTYGIAITNDRYVASDYCRDELKQLLAHCGPERVIEIRYPAEPGTRRAFPQLEAAPSLDLEPAEDPDAALALIGKITEWRIVAEPEPLPAAPKRVYSDKWWGFVYSVDVTGWTLVDPSFAGGGPCYCLHEPPLFWNLQYGREDNPDILRARLGGIGSRIDDRLVLDQMREYALRYFTEVNPAPAAGVHLYFLNGAAHLALTYSHGRFWKRRYSMILARPVTGRVAEFLFTFQFEGDFAEYCRHVEIMDSVVASLRWESVRMHNARLMAEVMDLARSGSRRARRWLAQVYLALVAGGLLGGGLAYLQIPDWTRAIALGLGSALVAGYFARRFLPPPFD